jgi:hypothetical protein
MYEIFTAASIKMMIAWDIMAHSSVDTTCAGDMKESTKVHGIKTKTLILKKSCSVTTELN